MPPVARRSRDERGAALLEFALVFPLVIGALGLAMFAAHSYLEKSEVQRAAQRTSQYAAVQCDPRAFDAAASSCRTTGYHDDAEIAAEAGRRLDRTAALACDVPSGFDQVNVCIIRTPAGAATPNQQVRVEVRQRFQSPFRDLVNLLPGDQQSMFILSGHGEAIVE